MTRLNILVKPQGFASSLESVKYSFTCGFAAVASSGVVYESGLIGARHVVAEVRRVQTSKFSRMRCGLVDVVRKAVPHCAAQDSSI